MYREWFRRAEVGLGKWAGWREMKATEEGVEQFEKSSKRRVRVKGKDSFLVVK